MDIVRRGNGDPQPGVLFEVGGSVTPFFDDRLLYHTWVGFAVDTNLLGNFDAIRFGCEPRMEKNKLMKLI